MLSRPTVLLLSCLLALTPHEFLAQTLFVAQNESNTVNLDDLGEELSTQIGNATGAGAVDASILLDDPDGFLCGLVVMKGNEEFHYHQTADRFSSVIHGGGYMNLGEGLKTAPIGANILFQAGQPHQLFNRADDYTSVITCFSGDDSGATPAEDASPIPPESIASLPLPTSDGPVFWSAETGKIELLTFAAPADGEALTEYSLVESTATGGMKVSELVLATSQEYQMNANSSIWAIVVEGNVQTSSAASESDLITIPEGSSIVLKKGEGHKFVNTGDASSPARILLVFAPANSGGGSVTTNTTEPPATTTEPTMAPADVPSSSAFQAQLAVAALIGTVLSLVHFYY